MLATGLADVSSCVVIRVMFQVCPSVRRPHSDFLKKNILFLILRKFVFAECVAKRLTAPHAPLFPLHNSHPGVTLSVTPNVCRPQQLPLAVRTKASRDVTIVVTLDMLCACVRSLRRCAGPIELPILSTHLVRPGAGDAGEALHAAAKLHVLVRRVQVLEAVLDVRRHPRQRLPAEQHAWPAHAEVLVELQRQQAELLLVSAAGLADELRLGT